MSLPRFFIPSPTDQNHVQIEGENAKHIAKSLRMKQGEQLVLCDGYAHDYICRISSINSERVTLEILERRRNTAEPRLKAHLYQAMPKGDKFETIIQKSVELGVTQITPVLTSRCISRPNAKTMRHKLERYNKIAEQAAKQSGRGVVPTVNNMVSFEQALGQMADDHGVLFYECEGEPMNSLLAPQQQSVSFMVGSEGGFSPVEVEAAKRRHLRLGNLGPRILRCETAPLCILSVLMFLSNDL